MTNNKKKLTDDTFAATDIEGRGTGGNKMFMQCGGSVSSLLSVSLFKLCRGTGRNWSGLAFAALIYQALLIPALHKHKRWVQGVRTKK